MKFEIKVIGRFIWNKSKVLILSFQYQERFIRFSSCSLVSDATVKVSFRTTIRANLYIIFICTSFDNPFNIRDK